MLKHQICDMRNGKITAHHVQFHWRSDTYGATCNERGVTIYYRNAVIKRLPGIVWFGLSSSQIAAFCVNELEQLDIKQAPRGTVLDMSV